MDPYAFFSSYEGRSTEPRRALSPAEWQMQIGQISITTLRRLTPEFAPPSPQDVGRVGQTKQLDPCDAPQLTPPTQVKITVNTGLRLDAADALMMLMR